jgi:hypothetical protein
MMQAMIRIDEREYLLPPERDEEAIMDLIASQVRAGGGFVEIVRTPNRVVNVLVSPGTNVSIESRRVEDLPPAPDEVLEGQWWGHSWLDPFDVL